MHRFHASSLPRLLRAPRRWALATSLCLLPAAQALATPLTYNFSGVVTRVTWLLGGAVGDSFHGAFSFDSEPVAAVRTLPFTAFSVWVDARGGPLGFSSTNVGGHLSDRADSDGVQVIKRAVTGQVNGSIVMQGGTGGYHPFDILSPLDLAGFNSASLGLDAKELTTGHLDGRITSLVLVPAASVPEPGSWALVALGLIGLAGARRQRGGRGGWAGSSR